jgi:uncharacterized lipoprotein
MKTIKRAFQTSFSALAVLQLLAACSSSPTPEKSETSQQAYTDCPPLDKECCNIQSCTG